MTTPTARIPRLRTGSGFHLVRHVVEMSLVMMAGMMLGASLFASVVGTSVPEARREHALAWGLVMVVDMTVPMVAWMLFRGHSRRSAAEMAAAMIVPALPLVALQLAHVVSGSVGGPYMLASTVAMIALIAYRRSEYRAAAQSHA